MSISPEDTTVSSRLNIHVGVIVPIGVSINKCFIPWSVEEYIVLMNKHLNHSRGASSYAFTVFYAAATALEMPV
jgi:hypothetical protein